MLPTDRRYCRDWESHTPRSPQGPFRKKTRGLHNYHGVSFPMNSNDRPDNLCGPIIFTPPTLLKAHVISKQPLNRFGTVTIIYLSLAGQCGGRRGCGEDSAARVSGWGGEGTSPTVIHARGSGLPETGSHTRPTRKPTKPTGLPARPTGRPADRPVASL